ncbi:sugar isomerase [Fulvivirgaceae bacterium BMA12]|uniref:Sugar isomerase n=1 Tax=Agaribacillus aureus TaxID=3051825 RepID=A0ABT8L224_9BACT|nr:sugar isomerase [Fulvivirgaceae bacterium BMA12]
MNILPGQINGHNDLLEKKHRRDYQYLENKLTDDGHDTEELVRKIKALQVAIPSWALGTGGTRFGRFPGGGEPRNLEEKIGDIGTLHKLNRSSGAISLHIPWDIPDDPKAILDLAKDNDLVFDAVNSNTFQDQPRQAHSYKFGSLAHTEEAIRDRSIAHNLEVIKYGELLGSKSLTVWLADGTCFPGQQNFRKAFMRTLESLQEIYAGLPHDWKMLIEYKPYEPNFYSTVIQDWGSSHLLAGKLGNRAFSLVDLGHHLPNTNIEQIVALLIMEGKLGGFHFNDSKYGDDDLTVGSIKPYQLFLVFNELVEGIENPALSNPTPAWMIDASHNVKDPLEDLLQSVEAIKIAYARALLVKQHELEEAREQNDVVKAQELLQNAFRTDVRPLVAEARLRSTGALDPVGMFRELAIRQQLITERGHKTISTGL